MGGNVRVNRPDELADFVKGEVGKWAKVVKAAGIRAESPRGRATPDFSPHAIVRAPGRCLGFGIGIHEYFGDLAELGTRREEGVHDIRVEVLLRALTDDLDRLLVRKRRLVDALADERVVDVGYRHQACRQ